MTHVRSRNVCLDCVLRPRCVLPWIVSSFRPALSHQSCPINSAVRSRDLVITNHSSPALSDVCLHARAYWSVSNKLDKGCTPKETHVSDNWPGSLATITELDVKAPILWNVAIEALSDDVLLEIFAFCLYKDEDHEELENEEMGLYRNDAWFRNDAWYVLVHVCQRWRYTVFASPRRLNLRLHCTRKRPVRSMLGIWPAFPIVIWDLPIFIWDIPHFTLDEDNIIAALEHHDRVCEIRLRHFTISESERLVLLMQQSFPALTKLQLSCSYYEPAPALPDSFLGGSAPHLRFLSLESVSFPALPNLLMSASHLVHLELCGTPPGFISPEMVTALSVLTRLEIMLLFFEYPDPDSNLQNRAPPPQTPAILPALMGLELRGDGEYLDDFVARIEVPSLDFLEIEVTHRPFFVVHFSHLPRFIGRIEKFRTFDYARFDLDDRAMNVLLSMQRWTRGSRPGGLRLKFLCDANGPLPSLVEACNTSLLPLRHLSNLNYFVISTRYSSSHSPSESNTVDPLWLEVLRQFSSARTLSLESMQSVPPIAFTLKQVIEEGMTDVLPAIQRLFVSGPLSAGPVREGIEQFVTARGLSETAKQANHSEWRITARNPDDG